MATDITRFILAGLSSTGGGKLPRRSYTQWWTGEQTSD
jgi:hypothetical protein